MKKQGNAKEYMSFDDAVPVLIRLCAIMVPIMAVIMGLLVTNRVGLGYDGFAADSHERIYAGRSGVIDIYENGKKVGEAEAPSSRWYSFMIVIMTGSYRSGARSRIIYPILTAG